MRPLVKIIYGNMNDVERKYNEWVKYMGKNLHVETIQTKEVKIIPLCRPKYLIVVYYRWEVE